MALKIKTFRQLELLASQSLNNLNEFSETFWIYLTSNQKACNALGKDLEIANYRNPGNVYQKAMYKLTEGVYSHLYE